MRTCTVTLLAALLALSGCGTTQQQSSPAAEFTLEEVLGRMPPRDTLEARWLGSALLDLGPGAVERLCGELDTAGAERRTQVEYALRNAALYVSRRGAEEARRQYVGALASALDRPPSTRTAVFVLEQLQLVGAGESVASAARFLGDPELCGHTARALVAIRDGADQALLNALAGSEGRCRLAIIQGLGALKCVEAVEALGKEAGSEDADVRRAALEALERIESPADSPAAILTSAGSKGAASPARHIGPDSVRALLVPLERSEDPSEIADVRRALDALPCESFASPVAESLPRLTPLATVAMLDLLGKCGTLVPDDQIALIATSGNGAPQLAAIRTLGTVGGEGVQQDLIGLAGSSADQKLVGASQKSLTAVCLRRPDPEKRADALIEAYDGGSRQMRLALLPVLGRVGGNRALTLTAAELHSQDPDIREAAVRALCDWPSVAAYDTLLAVAEGKERTHLRILALRGCVRMVEQAPLTPTEAVRYHERTLRAAWRAEEKRLVLGTLANLRTPYALRVVAPYVADDSVGLDAALAAGRIAGGEGEANGEMGSSQAARAFINAYLPLKYREQVNRALDLSPSMNIPPRGFRTLFNGRDLDGWKGLVGNPVSRSAMSLAELASAQERADSSMRAHWSVADGVLLFDGKGESLCTAEDFGDFEMLVDWKIEPFGDSGIYLRGSPQVQIWDPARWPEGSGGLYNNQKNPRAPLQCADRPIGDWNTFRIRMIGDRVTVHLNGVLVADNVILENYWDRSIPIFPSGQIELQSHESPLAFRNIFIREIPRKKELFSGPLFNGRDLSGWTVVGGRPEAWGGRDGILFTNGEDGGWLSTDREYDNFALELEFRVGEGGNSGVFLRAPHEGDPAYTGMEIQVLDNNAEEYAALRPWQYCGSLYGVAAAKKGAFRKANEWQRYRIVALGPNVTVTLNGQQIVDADLTAYMHLEASHPGLKRRSGFIGLQCHGDRVEYRNITLTELEWSENHDGN